MPAVAIYTDSDTFAGAAADLGAGHATVNGNQWTNINTTIGTIILDGFGALFYNGGSSVNFHSLYQLNVLDANFPNLTLEEYSTLEITITVRGPQSGPRQWGAYVSPVDAAFNGRGYGWASSGFVSSSTTEASLLKIEEGFINSTEPYPHATTRSLAPLVTIISRSDPYQSSVVFNTSGLPQGDLRFLNFPLPSFRASSRILPAIVMFDSGPFDGTRSSIEDVSFSYLRLDPLAITPQWIDYGSTAVLDTGPISFTDVFSTATPALDEPLVNVGGFDIFTSKLHADRALLPHMLILDNRRNPGVVDVIIGPFRWRAGAFSEMELPLPKELNIDRISLRGGGTNSRCRLFAHEIPKTFRQ